MIDLSTITAALQTQLNADATVAAHLKGRVVERTEAVNENAGHTPWVCVYRGKTRAEPRTLGAGAQHWQVLPTVRIMVQAASTQSGAEAEDKLEEIVKDCIDAVLADPTIGSTVDMVTAIDWDYLYMDVTRTRQHFQTAIIDLSIDARAS